jgi:hypothetical protein
MWLGRTFARHHHTTIHTTTFVATTTTTPPHTTSITITTTTTTPSPQHPTHRLPIFGVKDQPDTWRFRQAQPHGEPRVTKYQSKTFERWFRARVPKLDDRPWDQMSLVPEF